MNWWIFFLTLGFVVLEGLVSRKERTLVQTGFPFIKHGGIWADLLIFPFINGLIWNYLQPSRINIPLLILTVLAFTMAMHLIWFYTQETTSWLWPTHDKSHDCFLIMSWAGWLHVLFMAFELLVLVLYAFSPAPAANVLAVAFLLTIFWPLGVIQPCWYLTGKWLDAQALIISIGLVGGTWLITAFKL